MFEIFYEKEKEKERKRVLKCLLTLGQLYLKMRHQKVLG